MVLLSMTLSTAWHTVGAAQHTGTRSGVVLSSMASLLVPDGGMLTVICLPFHLAGMAAWQDVWRR